MEHREPSFLTAENENGLYWLRLVRSEILVVRNDDPPTNINCYLTLRFAE